MNLTQVINSIGWLGFLITLTILICLNKCGDKPVQTIQKETIINNFYDSGIKSVPQISYLPGKVILQPIPTDVDTQKILAAYFAKYAYTRTFENDSIKATLVDTICQNKFLSKGKFTYKWLPPVKTVESTTITITNTAPSKMMLMVGLHAGYIQNSVKGFGPDIYLKTKRDQLIGVGYDIDLELIRINTAISIGKLFKK